MLEVNVWGLSYYGVEVEVSRNQYEGIHPYEFVGYVLLFIQHAKGIFKVSGYSGSLLIEASLGSILGIPWLQLLYGGFLVEPGAKSELDDDVTFSIATSTDALDQRPDGIAMDILRRVFFSVNWPRAVQTADDAQRLLLSGYEFNSWPKPASLKT
jgi:hypothetical protein